jgi:hypothetical protein
MRLTGRKVTTALGREIIDLLSIKPAKIRQLSNREDRGVFSGTRRQDLIAKFVRHNFQTIRELTEIRESHTPIDAWKLA